MFNIQGFFFVVVVGVFCCALSPPLPSHPTPLPPKKKKNPFIAFIVYFRSFYLTIGLADFENVISLTGFKSHVLHSLKEKAIFLHI